MAVLKIVPKLYQEKISEKLKEEISLVTTGEAKYYNRLYKFFQYTDIQCTADINYETRKMYMDSLEKEDISEKYKAELLSLFDRLKIENMPDVYSQGKPFSVEQEFFKQDKLFLLYVPNKKKAQSFRQVVDKNDLLWDLTRIHSSQLVRQTKILLCEILNMDKVQRHRRYFLEPLKALIRFCDKYGIDDIEEMEQADENRFYLYLNKESEIIKKQASKIVEFARRTLFLTDSETNWRACIWYMDRFQFDKSRINASSPVKSLSFINIYEKENRWYLQLYAKYLVGISDLSLSNIRNTISFISQFLKYLDGQSKKVTELEMQDIADYVSVLDESDIKYSTFNRYITHMHTFLQFLKMKNIEVLKFYPERFLKKGFSEHNERSVPEKTIAHLIKELPAFPEHLQLMYLILFCTGIRKSEVCTIKSGAFYSQGNENWMRIYQSKMRREKVIPVPSLLVGLVNDYEKKYGIKNGEYLFKNKKGGAFNGQTFSNQMIRECKARGIACGDYIFRAHDYRHNLATSMYGNGVSIQGVRDYLDAVYDLVLNADGLDEDYSYQLKVREEQPSEKQANELFTQAKKEIDDSFCEENQSVEQVRGHVIMKDAYASGAVEAEWTLSDYDVVDINGDVNQDAFEEADDEQGKLISASVELSCGEHRQLYDFSFVVFPDELDAGERLIKGINRHIDSEMSKTGTKKLTLPDEVDGVKLSWSQEKSNTAAKIAMLEVVVIVLLVLEKKEKKKTAQKDRNIQLQLEYPEIVSKMAVLMGSGMTVEQAWNRITARYLDERKNNDKNIMPAYEEMLVTEREISDGVTGRKAYAGFAERVKLPCYQKLIRIILQSIHKGSKGVCEMLEKESEDAFDERRLLALKLGEEAGTKMLMPMMIMMAIVIAIVIAPAIIDFKI